ncbi:MAG: extracellular solute-binding protein [Candidatus Izemoplasmatales bacterium]|jgi:ABC-type glycerol-3-phosphate transport system substrate-binding protein|nr:extracellular solute-binding protein [Candidatus Izemoplasmatales bacterium]
MSLTRKFIGLFMLVVFAFVFIGCNNTTTQEITQNTTDNTTEVTETTNPTTDTGTVTTDTETSSGDGVPQFIGLFPRQTVYKGSQVYDILAGAKAVDEEDGELEIQVAGAFSTTRVGTYEVYVYAQDSDGNTTTELITLTVKELSAFAIPDELTSDPITIELWHSNGATIEAALNGYADEFELLHPNITVVITKNGNNYDELRENMVNAIRGGQIPNIVQNYPDHVMEYIDNNGVIPLTPYIYHPIHGYDPAVEEESFLDILLSYRRENSQYANDGEYYSVPFNKSTEVMIYNKSMFDRLIADGVIDEVPNTWQGLFELGPALMAIKDDVIDEIAANLNASPTLSVHKTPAEIQAIKDNFVPITYDSPANAFITLTRQWGGEYTGITSARTGIIKFDNPQTRAMLSYFFDNRDDVFTLPGKWGTEYASDAFKVGQTAVTFGSTGGARYNTPTVVDGEYVFEFGLMPMPYNADMPENRTAIQQGTNMSITTAGDDQQKLASWLFLQFLTSKDTQLDFALKTGYSPVRYSVYDTPEYIQFTQGLDSSGNPLGGEALMISLAANAAAQQSDFLFYDQAFIGSSTARAEVEIAFERVILQSLEGTTKQQIIDNAIAAAVENSERVLQ